ncbi:MAG: integrase [Candidatus Aminicenantes bacterium]|nr:integrase [Candidatus Aminicenantes bacterium]
MCKCGGDLDKAKRSERVRYWIDFYIPGGKQRREPVGYSIDEAKDAIGKRRSQKREGRFFDMLPESKMTFSELSKWYLDLTAVRSLSSFKRIKVALGQFNKTFGDRIVGSIKPIDLEDYQAKREEAGKSPATIDMELSIARTMINKAFDNDMIGGHIVKAFRKINRKLKRGSNARDRIVEFSEYLKLIEGATLQIRTILTIAFYTGMRKGEILNLRWPDIDRKKNMIRLAADATKEAKPKMIPISHHVRNALESLPRALRHDYVFMYRGEPITDVRNSFETLCESAGIAHGRATKGGMTFHDIRTTVKTNMLRAGIDKALRDTILGHSLSGMDAFYIKPTEDDLHRAMDKYTRWIDRQIKSANLDQTIDQKRS